ncbi:MAG TPA: dienelactone hydrolase family protein [Candidatus Eisenbacteria bacterium]
MKRTIPGFAGAALLLTACATLAGAAPARKPAPAATVTAADTSRVHLGPAGASTDAFVALPPGSGNVPGVVVIQEWWGLNGQIREIARRLAKEGYVAIAPDLYHGKVTSDPEMAHTLMRGLDENRALVDLNEAARWLAAQPRTAGRRMGVVGFCMGGRLAELFALGDSSLAAAVMFYGYPETRPDRLAALRAPLQGHFGAEDQGIPPDSVAAFQAALSSAGKFAEIHLYPGAGHAFMHEGRKSYRADAAKQAWARTLAFFQKYLKE